MDERLRRLEKIAKYGSFDDRRRFGSALVAAFGFDELIRPAYELIAQTQFNDDFREHQVFQYAAYALLAMFDTSHDALEFILGNLRCYAEYFNVLPETFSVPSWASSPLMFYILQPQMHSLCYLLYYIGIHPEFGHNTPRWVNIYEDYTARAAINCTEGHDRIYRLAAAELFYLQYARLPIFYPGGRHYLPEGETDDPPARIHIRFEEHPCFEMDYHAVLARILRHGHRLDSETRRLPHELVRRYAPNNLWGQREGFVSFRMVDSIEESQEEVSEPVHRFPAWINAFDQDRVYAGPEEGGQYPVINIPLSTIYVGEFAEDDYPISTRDIALLPPHVLEIYRFLAIHHGVEVGSQFSWHAAHNNVINECFSPSTENRVLYIETIPAITEPPFRYE